MKTREARGPGRSLLRLYPRRFRERFGEEFLADWRRIREEEGRLAAWRRMGVDAGSLPRLWWDVWIRREGRGAMGAVLQDLKHAMRGLLRVPGFTLAAAVTLAVGIGATTGVFGLVRAIVLDPLSFDPDDRLVRVWPGGNLDRAALTVLRTEGRAWDVASGYARMEMVHEVEGAPTRLMAAAVSGEHFTLTGASAGIGRLFGRGDFAPDASPVVVLSHRLWATRFAGDPSILGRDVRITRGDVDVRTVVGVLPEGYRDLGYGDADLWVPLPSGASDDPVLGDLFVTARLAPGVDVEAASAALVPLARRIQEADPTANRPGSAERAAVTSLHEFFVPDGVRRTLGFLMLSVALVFLIACGNVANLLLVRARARRREISIRHALGAGAGRVFRLAMSESLLIGLVAGGLGILCASIAESWTIARLTEMRIPRLEDAGLGASDLAFALGLTLFAIAVVGGIPALRMSRVAGTERLRSGSRGAGDGPERARLARTLVGGQVALATVVAVAALLMVRSGGALERVDPGFETAGLLSVRVEIEVDATASAEEVRSRLTGARERLAEVPGVEAVSIARCAPMSRCSGWSGYWRADEDPAEVDRGRAFAWFAEPATFAQLGIEVVAGRLWPADAGAEIAGTVLISETMARDLWPDGPAVGRTVRLHPEGAPREVTGVVADVLHAGRDRDATPTVWLPFEHYSTSPYGYADAVLIATVQGDPADFVMPARTAVWSAEPRLPLEEVAPLSMIARGVGGPADAIRLFLGIFTLLGLALSFAGVWAVAAWTAAQRRRETAIRIAIGAGTREVLATSLRRGMLTVGIGGAVGLICAPIFVRSLESFLFGVEPAHAANYLSIGAGILVVGLLANLGPALRAVRTPPAEVLAGDG